MAPLRNLLCLALFALAEARPSTGHSALSKRAADNSTDPLTDDEQKELFDLHEKLVDIPSISGDEAKATDFLEQYLSELGYYVEKLEVEKNRHNVFAYPQELKDDGSWPEVLITSHIDTVTRLLAVK